MPNNTGSATPTSGTGTSTATPQTRNESFRHKITSWMERTFGRAALPIAALAGGAAGFTVGSLLLGPFPGGVIGAIGGAFLGGALFMSD